MKRKYLGTFVKWRRYKCGDANDASWRFLASKGHVTKYASYRDMIQFCKIEGKENNAITYVSQSSYEIGSWEFPFKISIIRILYCLKSRELLCWKLNHFLDIWSTEEKLSNPLFPLNNSDKGGKISVGIFMRVKSLKSLRTRRVGNFFCHFNFY